MTKPHLHCIFVCVGTHGDIYPPMRIAKAMQALGHRVTFITNTYHSRLLTGSGLPFVGMGTGRCGASSKKAGSIRRA